MINIAVISRSYGKDQISPVVDNQLLAMSNLGLVKVYRFKIRSGGIEYIKRLNDFRKFLKSNPIDLIHAHYSFCGYFAALSFTNIPIICSLMGSDVLRSRVLVVINSFFIRFIWKRTIVKSKQMQRVHPMALVIPNGVDFENFLQIDKSLAMSKIGFSDKNKHIIFVSTNPNIAEKNIDLALKAVKIAQMKTDIKIEFHVISDAKFIELPYFYSAADLLLLTSISEGSPNVIKEAMACNCPIVATNVGDILETIGKTDGCYVSSFNSFEIAECIIKSIETNRRTNGRNDISYLNNKVILIKIINLYKEIINNEKQKLVNDNILRDKSLINPNDFSVSAGICKNLCVKGVWDESIPGITFDEKGVSNYAKLFNTLVEAYPRGEKGKVDWENIVSLIKKEGVGKKYDCIVGVSGGTDSSYLLHYVKEIGLRPLAVYLDNGWSSEIATHNIEKMIKALDIDLITYVINYEEVKDLLKSYMLAGLPWIDMPTDLAIKSILYKIASKQGIKFVLRGNDFRTEGTQPKEWTYGDGKQLNFVHKKFGKVKLKTFPNYTLSNLIYYGFIKGIKSIYPYYYINYNKSEAQKLLTKKYNWSYYGGHHHENVFTKFAISYWLPKKFNIDKRKITYSALILSGEMSREDAILSLANSPYDPSSINQTIEFVLKKLDLNEADFSRIMNAENHSFTDYPSYDYIFQKLIKISKPFLNLLFLHKPQSIFQSEMRNKK